MGIGFMDRWRARHRAGAAPDAAAPPTGPSGHAESTAWTTDPPEEPAGDAVAGTVADRERSMAELFGECGLLRELAEDAGVALDDSVTSLTALDQLLPAWRDDPQVSEWLGNDAGLYLGTVLHRTVPGAHWRIGEQGRPMLVLPSGREVDVTVLGHGWADQGTPQLAAAYLASTEV
ncbi:DUF6278 family protein [Kitasatospora cinereorecta]|uniref:DUF6278 family protein n=1 Tax=Kitasatospora cinereorecta TaxID=285560 RepID=A0ABW0VKL3_9ACTN